MPMGSDPLLRIIQKDLSQLGFDLLGLELLVKHGKALFVRFNVKASLWCLEHVAATQFDGLIRH